MSEEVAELVIGIVILTVIVFAHYGIKRWLIEMDWKMVRAEWRAERKQQREADKAPREN